MGRVRGEVSINLRQRYKDHSNVNANTCRSYLHDQFILLEMMVSW